jgi:hypothetical protein
MRTHLFLPRYAAAMTEEEYEGALWYLAATIQLRGSRFDALEWVEDAKRNWSIGLTAWDKGVVTDSFQTHHTRTP